jgi:hypothetical protein
MSTATSIAAGSLPLDKYGGELGFAGVRMIHPLDKCLGLICGYPGGGKSCLIQSHENGFILNLDKSSTTCEEPKAVIWPGINQEGDPIDIDGRTFILDWEATEAKKQLLVKLARENKPRPRTVFIDSVTEMVRLLKDYITRDNNKEKWQDMDGRRAWDRLYDMIVSFCEDLRRAGYGVYLICHVVNAVVPVGEDMFKEVTELTLGKGGYKRLYPSFEVVAVIEKITRNEYKEQENKPIKNPRTGKEMTRKKPKTIKVEKTVHVFAVESKKLDGIVKHRVNMPDEIELPAVGGWAYVSNIYAEAANHVPAGES